MTTTTAVNIITIKELASELFINSKSLRKKLRDNAIPKPGTRWEWPEEHQSVLTIRSWKDQPVKIKKKEKAENQDPRTLPHITEAEVEGEIIQIEVIEQKIVKLPENEGPQLLFKKDTPKGEWQVFKGEEGVKAVYATLKGLDATKWINEESEIRPTLPKYIIAEIKKALVL